MWQITRIEWLGLLRSTRWRLLLVGLIALLVITGTIGQLEHVRDLDQRATAAREVRAQWDAMGPSNPHGAAHFGTYAFKPAGALAALDPGTQAVTGNALRLEGHVQNDLAWSSAAQLPQVARFGEPHPALVLQVLVPLLLIVLGFASVSEERRSGRLRLLAVQGFRLRLLLLGKALALVLVGALFLLMIVALQLLLDGAAQPGIATRLVGFVLAYLLYYITIALLTVIISARMRRMDTAFAMLLGIWLAWTVAAPHVAAAYADSRHPLPDRRSFNKAMQADREQGVDGHNPEDTRRATLEQQVLAEYGVDSLKQLPFNFDGLVMQADEEYANAVWDKHFGALQERMAARKKVVQHGALIVPYLALRGMSMSAAGTDMPHHIHFQRAAETYRRDLVKRLNHEHAYGGSRTNDWSWKAPAEFFRAIPDFIYQRPPWERMRESWWADARTLLLWPIALLVLLFFLSSSRPGAELLRS
jgi:ABC-2 type transport system permease protein